MKTRDSQSGESTGPTPRSVTNTPTHEYDRAVQGSSKSPAALRAVNPFQDTGNTQPIYKVSSSYKSLHALYCRLWVLSGMSSDPDLSAAHVC